MPTPAVIAREIAGFVARNYPQPPGPDVARLMVEAWAEDLAELTDADLIAACSAYRRSTDPADRWWPTPGRLRALAPVGRAAAFLGGDADAEKAFEDFRARMVALAFRPDRDDAERHLDPEDPYRNDAMFAALATLAGPGWWGDPAVDAKGFEIRRRAWISVYAQHRKGQAHDAGAVKRLVARGQKQLGGPTA